MAFPAAIVVPRDLPINSPIPDASFSVSTTVPADGTHGVTCTFTGSETVPAVFTNYQGGLSSGNVTPIGSTGIGYTLVSNLGSTYVTGTKNLGAAVFATNSTCLATPCYLTLGPTVTMQLVKLQQTLSNPMLPGGEYMDVTIGGLVSTTISVSSPIQITSQTCSVTTPSINVDLGSVPVRKFTTVGSSSDPVNFNIGVDCTGLTTNLNITFTDAFNPSNRTNTLPLSSTSIASGVGIQILRNGAAVSYGPDSNIAGTTNQIAIGQVTGTTTTIPLTARYVQTTSTIRGGSANGAATFTMSYQ
ncbi:hypothetical protein BN2476_850016 [Paraburkholderia piptadeniae]|uniref:Fimbrial-type adhesion domain-containing protein n=1 Tax=Paraburkholderia piptadeniae TaxID=1701573 RepID=A0A1N7ST63_9BURK|nr:fimbrial protein [Paraburkholderia piptadeniae]SIT50583.1 hypothetical protein BN2476_850016 [Paraburkholderia piptadeniae]